RASRHQRLKQILRGLILLRYRNPPLQRKRPGVLLSEVSGRARVDDFKMTSEADNSIIDAWAQPAIKDAYAKLPEITRLFKQSGSTRMIESGLATEEIIEAMDRAGIQTLMLSAWHRPGQWVIHNDEVAEMA